MCFSEIPPKLGLPSIQCPGLAFGEPGIVRLLRGRAGMLLQLLVGGGLIAIRCHLIAIRRKLVASGQLASDIGPLLIRIGGGLVGVGRALVGRRRSLVVGEL